LTETSFYSPNPQTPQGTIVQPLYQNYLEADKRMHVYLPPGYKSNPEQRYPVLYLNHGGGDDDSAWLAKGSAAAILDNLIAAGKAKPMIVVMPNTKTCVKALPEKDDACTQEFVKDIVPYIDSNYRTKADRNNRAIAGLSMGGFVVMHTGLQRLDTFSELYVFSSGHVNSAGLQKFQELFEPQFKDATFNDRLRVPFYFAAGETDIALKNGQKNLAILNQHGVRNFWVLSTGGHEWANWRRYLFQTAQIMFPDCPAEAK
jgi:enterochelin esterase family protein